MQVNRAHFAHFRGSCTFPRIAVRLVVVEDHRALLEGLELLLGAQGLEVVGTASDRAGGEALVRATEPDVVVVDVGLGEESGIGLARDLLAERPERAVVLYTGSNDVELLVDGLDAGARGYALKEGAPAELLQAIEAVAQGGTYVDPRLRPALLSRRVVARQRALSGREHQVIELLADGLTVEEVGERLSLSATTVKTHTRNALLKLEARNRVHGIAIALRQGLIGSDPP